MPAKGGHLPLDHRRLLEIRRRDNDIHAILRNIRRRRFQEPSPAQLADIKRLQEEIREIKAGVHDERWIQMIEEETK